MMYKQFLGHEFLPRVQTVKQFVELDGILKLHSIC